jgi:hypothetical protein
MEINTDNEYHYKAEKSVFEKLIIKFWLLIIGLIASNIKIILVFGSVILVTAFITYNIFGNNNSKNTYSSSTPYSYSTANYSLSSSSKSYSDYYSSQSSISSKSIEAKVAADGGLLVRDEYGAIKYPNPGGIKQGSFDLDQNLIIDSLKPKKTFNISGESIVFVYAKSNSSNMEGWVAEKYIKYK